ncbi:hypothetical protein EXIGLDRAFT_36702 [Exidia glandulosa HHB12029]|uniref:Uncharacterized protein n=1 Tax=Exidia glandulosa HHB12029 TaxID=1314781 RepID=A0A166ANF0_EXIGL|nr:hypothetical protein EXIGLDRAFT_36702 [Exidia glandulosa HHB12029]
MCSHAANIEQSKSWLRRRSGDLQDHGLPLSLSSCAGRHPQGGLRGAQAKSPPWWSMSNFVRFKVAAVHPFQALEGRQWRWTSSLHRPGLTTQLSVVLCPPLGHRNGSVTVEKKGRMHDMAKRQSAHAYLDVRDLFLAGQISMPRTVSAELVADRCSERSMSTTLQMACS